METIIKLLSQPGTMLMIWYFTYGDLLLEEIGWFLVGAFSLHASHIIAKAADKSKDKHIPYNLAVILGLFITMLIYALEVKFVLFCIEHIR